MKKKVRLSRFGDYDLDELFVLVKEAEDATGAEVRKKNVQVVKGKRGERRKPKA